MDIKDVSIIAMLWGPKPPSAQDIIEVAQHAEELGFHSVGIPHRPIMGNVADPPPNGPVWRLIPPELEHYQIDALALVPMVLQATKTIRVGFNVVVTPWLHPFAWAKYLASLDVASGGRVIAGFGVGAGAPKEPAKSLANFGIDSSQRGKMSDEALDLITRLWTSDEVMSFKGDYYEGTDLLISPKSIQKPYPELWWAGKAKASITRAARYASFLEFSRPVIADIRDYYWPELQKANKQYSGNASIAVLLGAEVREDNLSEEDLSARYYGYQGENLRTLVVGNPERCAEVVRVFRQAGVKHFVFDFHRYGLEHVNVIHNQMEKFVTQVLPLV